MPLTGCWNASTKNASFVPHSLKWAPRPDLGRDLRCFPSATTWSSTKPPERVSSFCSSFTARATSRPFSANSSASDRAGQTRFCCLLLQRHPGTVARREAGPRLGAIGSASATRREVLHD